MFAALKRLFTKRGGASEVSQEPSVATPTLRPESQHPAGAQQHPTSTPPVAIKPTVVARPGIAPSQPIASAPLPRQAAPITPTTGEILHIPLEPILESLSADLQKGIAKRPGREVRIPLAASHIVPQLPTGAVKIPFGELRKVCPPGTFFESNVHDSNMISLPLDVIVQNVPPHLLTRRTDQRKAVNPVGYDAVFHHPNQPGTPAAAPSPIPASAPGPFASPSAGPTPTPLRPAHPPMAPLTPRPVTPAASATKLPFVTAKPVAPPPQPAVAVPPPPPPSSPAIIPFNSLAPAAAPPPPPSQAPAMAPSMETGTLNLPMHILVSALPDPMQKLFSGSDLSAAQLVLPMSEAEQGLKRGMLAFPWGQMQSWITPNIGNPNIPEETLVHIPLKLVVPLFLARKTPSAPSAKRVEVAENIPDVFSSAPPAPASANAPTAPAAERQPTLFTPPPAERVATEPPTAAAPARPTLFTPPTAMPEPPVQPMPSFGAVESLPTPGEELSLGTIFGQSGKQSWTPVEIVHKTAALAGVAGALVALQDGLLVAGDVPSELNAETIAAFMPQMFGRMSHYTRELKFGDPASMVLTVDRYTLYVFKTGTVFFMVIGRPDEKAPVLQLQAIAAQLARQSK